LPLQIGMRRKNENERKEKYKSGVRSGSEVA